MVVEETDISTTSSLMIEDINQEDDGIYACAAFNELDRENKTREFEIGPQGIFVIFKSIVSWQTSTFLADTFVNAN